MHETNSKIVTVRPSIFQFTKSRKNYRTSDDIKAETLNCSRNGALRTQIFYTCNLSYYQLQKYLRFLNDNGFLNVQEIEGHKIYTTTEKGIKWLQAYQQLRSIK